MAVTRSFRGVWGELRLHWLAQSWGYLWVSDVPLALLEPALRQLTKELDNAWIVDEFSLGYGKDERPRLTADRIPFLMGNPDRSDFADDEDYATACKGFTHRFVGDAVDFNRFVQIAFVICRNRPEGEAGAFDIGIDIEEDALPDADRDPDDCIAALQKLLDLAVRLAGDHPGLSAGYQSDIGGEVTFS